MGSPDTRANFLLQELSVVQFPLQKVCSRSLHQTPEQKWAPRKPTTLVWTTPFPTEDGQSKTSRLWENQQISSLAPILLPVLSNAVPRLKYLQPLHPFPPHHEAGTRYEAATTCTGSIGFSFPLIIGLPVHTTYRASNIQTIMAVPARWPHRGPLGHRPPSMLLDEVGPAATGGQVLTGNGLTER